MKKYFVLGLALLLAFGFFALSQQEVKDPVCGMKLKAEEAKFKSEYKGTTYYFCSADCKAKFDKEPEKYVVKPAHKPMAICCALGEEIMKNAKVEKKETEKSLVFTLTSSDPDVVKKLQENIGKCKMMEGKMEHMEHKEMKHEECCMMHMKGVKSTIKNIKEGVQIEFTSENPETLKMLKKSCGESSCCGKKEHKH